MSSKDGIAAICSHQDAINKCSLYGLPFYFPSFSPLFRHFSSFEWHEEACIIGIHLLHISVIYDLLSDGLLNWYIWQFWWLNFKKWNRHWNSVVYMLYLKENMCEEFQRSDNRTKNMINRNANVTSKTVITSKKEQYSLPYSLSACAILMMPVFFTPYHCFCIRPAIMTDCRAKEKRKSEQHLIRLVCRSSTLFLYLFSNNVIQKTLVTLCRFRKWRCCKIQGLSDFVVFISSFREHVLNMP